jgi:N-acetyltransferase
MRHRSSEMSEPPDYFTAVVLAGERVRLEPLSAKHCEDLSVAGAEPEIWRWLPSEHHAPGSMASFISGALAQHERRRAVPFATIDLRSSRAVGSTRYHAIEPEQRRLEIGVTWIAPALQRSHVNTEAKLLQLWYAFEVLGCRRVEFKADAENLRSRNAILRLGAREEGYFRKHMIYPDGRNRDSVYYAIVDDEWATCKASLIARLGGAAAFLTRRGLEAMKAAIIADWRSGPLDNIASKRLHRLRDAPRRRPGVGLLPRGTGLKARNL